MRTLNVLRPRSSSPINHAGRIVVSLVVVISAIGQTDSDRYPIVVNGKVGFIDRAGNEVVTPQYFPIADMAHFTEGLAPVVGTEGAGYIDPSGRFVIGPTREWGQPRTFHENIAGVLIWGKDGARNTPAFVDRNGRVILSGSEIAEGTYFSEGLMPLHGRGGWGFVDKDFGWVIPPKYEWAGEFSEGLGPIRAGRKLGYIDTRGNEIVPPKYDLVWAFSDGVGRVRIDIPTGTNAMTMEGPKPVYKDLYGFVDRHGNEVIPPWFEWATDFHDSRAIAKPPGSKLLAIIDKHGNLLHEPQYEQSGEFREGLAAACSGGKWGYVDPEGSWVIRPQFVVADNFWHGLARVAWIDGRGYVDRTGVIVWRVQNKAVLPTTAK
jgi:hypothetical protein